MMHLDKATIRQVEQAIQEICKQGGWGEIKLIIERGVIRRIAVQYSLNLKLEE